MLRVILRGIGYRRSRSMVVLLLSLVAAAAAVLTPAYISAAHQSLLTDAMTRQTTVNNGIRVSTNISGPELAAGNVDPEAVLTNLDTAVTRPAVMSILEQPRDFAGTGVVLNDPQFVYPSQSRMAYRQDFCDHVTMVEGDCTTETGQVLMSKRAAESQEMTVGDGFAVEQSVDGGGVDFDAELVGIYQAHDVKDPYWGRQSPFNFGTDANGTNFIDSMFVTEVAQLSMLPGSFRAGIEYSIDPYRIRLDQSEQLAATMVDIDHKGTAADPDGSGEYELFVDASYPGLLADVRIDKAEVSQSVPVVTIPLMLLCWFVLFMVTARLTEERGPQIALAKLRGHRFAGVAGFGTGEAVLLIVAGVPLGTAVGLGAVELVARTAMAPGAGITVSSGIAAYALVALMGGLAAVLLAARHTLRRPVLALLRRIPSRGGWRAGLIEGALVALAAVAVWQVLDNPQLGTLGLFTTPLLALLVGVAAARALQWWARGRQPAAVRRGRLVTMLARAQLSRRPEIRRTVILVTVAVSLVTFGVCAWDIAGHNRQLAADDELGADRVYRIAEAGPEVLMDTVAELDPDGTQLMGVMRSFERYDGKQFSVVATQTDRLAEVARWRDKDATDLADLADRLHPDAPDPLQVTGEIAAEVNVDKIDSEDPLKLVARVARAGELPRLVRLGELSDGTDTYQAELPDCDEACRLIGLGIVRHPGDFAPIEVSARIDAVEDADGPIDAGLDQCGAWQPAWDRSANSPLTVECDDAGTILSADTTESDDLIAEYVAAPQVLPVALAGEIPDADPEDGRFDLLGPHDELQAYEVADTESVVPRGGTSGLMVDLDYTNRFSQSITSLGRESELFYEVWATDDAPADLDEQLTQAGLVVVETKLRSDEVERLGRSAPALALRLYLLAAVAAFALVMGVIALTATIGAAARGYDTAALRVAGVSRRTLRMSAAREQLSAMLIPMAGGMLTGLAGLALILPNVNIVPVASASGPIVYRLGPWLPGGALALMIVGFAMVTWLSLRAQRRRGVPARIRSGEA